ncbi:C2H2 finger domain transcription factor [Colletotrichum truncatum]|uniref:C2H2 finger domain transcription factor n=1 Tax=Colletotrichum truncatum TaxID=5467 RepID=A0ACC3ZHW2_COLTU|nr:C2H2 finger domain transcription factor [Colletotrichum truncatum]KAF6790612.1 C2H2 finger domain transcription factor [Colletotrichum truncatum]
MSDSQSTMTGQNHRHNSVSSDGFLGEEKTFTCSHPGCDKRFTRAEHMQRHALNHMPGGLACDICRAHFKRPDLLSKSDHVLNMLHPNLTYLERHMDRHRQKDFEAGGPGCGVLDTRKRSWKAPDGTVVEKRPCTNTLGRGRPLGRARPQTTQVPSPEPECTDVEHSHGSLDGTGDHDFSVGSISPDNQRQHPPDLRHESFDTTTQSYHFDRGTIFTSESVNDFTGFPPSLQIQDYLSANNHFSVDESQPGSWGDPFASDLLDYEQIFQPDTASSFNMPYTTALDYNWLFNMQETSSPMIASKTANQNYDFHPTGAPSVPRTHTNVAITPESMKSAQLWTEPMDTAPREPDGQDKPPSYNTIVQSAPQEPPRRLATRNSGERNSEPAALRRPVEAQAPARKRRTTVSRPPPILEPERPLSFLKNSLNIPALSENVREGLLNTVEAAKPSLPDQRYTLWEHPLLSLESLQSYLDLFFKRFNTAYPLIHLETFNCAETEPLLLLSIILLGATYSSKDCHQLAVCIHDVIRPSIFAHPGFSPRPELWTLQTILLVECFGKSRAGQKQHDMSHLFHGLLINLIRRSDCQSVRPPGPPPVGGDDSPTALEKTWRKWAEAEQKKRLALLCFMWDTQHAVLFCQSLCMSAFELRLELPCNQSIWEAQDATSWASAWRSSINDQRTFYLPVLKAYLMPSGPRTHGLSGFSRILVLHGLMSIAWDMGRRDQTALGVVSGDNPGTGWRTTLSSAYDAWRSDFDWYCDNFFAQMPRAPPSADDDARKMEFESFTTAYKTLYHSAQSLLNMDFLDVQIYAGARHILGRPVQQKDYLRSAQVVKRWAAAAINMPRDAQAQVTNIQREREPSAGTSSTRGELQKPFASVAAWHAAQILRETKKKLSGIEAMNLFHVPWCLYLATLTCWAYHHARPNRSYGSLSRRQYDAMGDFDNDEDGEDDEMVWDPQAEMDALVASMSERADRNDVALRNERRRTNGLVWIMADILTTVRWGIVHAGVVVLRGLVPQRLINQYEEAT